MKLLMITGDRALAAGKQGAFYSTLEGLHKHFDRIDVICPNPGVHRYEMQIFGNVYVHPSPWLLFLQPIWIWWQGRRIARHHRPDLMTVHDYAPFYNGIGAWFLLMSLSIPYVQEIMHIPGIPRASSIRERIYRWLSYVMIPWGAQKACAVRVINRHEVPRFLIAAGVPESKILYMPAFYIDFEVFKPRESQKQYDIAFVGRMARNKGVELFLKVLEKTELVGVAVGDGPLLPWVRKEVKRRGLKLHTPGFANDSSEVAAYLNCSRLLLMPSLNEGGPRVVLEALACGVPVVATPVGIVPDILPPEAIEEWDVVALAEKVRNILVDDQLYHRLRSSGLQAVMPFERHAAIAAYADALKSCIQ
jgi:glycosyltransferase involved in cell wall biosynthesis